MSVCCECCVLSGREPATSRSLVQKSPTDCDAALRMRRPWPALGRSATKKQRCHYVRLTTYWFNFVFQSNYCRIWLTHYPHCNQLLKTVRTSKNSNEVPDI